MKRMLSIGMLVGSLSSAAWAGSLPIGGVEFNPFLEGQGITGNTGPFYTEGLPTWLTPGNLLASLSSPIQSISGFLQFRGTVQSFVYNIPFDGKFGGVGFAYRIILNSNSTNNLNRASLGPSFWETANIWDAGSDGSGVSSPVGTSVFWNDGDPFFIERDGFTGAPAWSLRLGTDGTELDAGNRSALVWFATDGVGWTQSDISLLDGGALGAARVLAIPEPATISLMLLALCGLRRR
ncbi:MAG: hypothetical protein SF069_14390 [Phycisphaerae bacterium]|nr:hypothetical protein [Phycisphaerae bacterium]